MMILTKNLSGNILTITLIVGSVAPNKEKKYFGNMVIASNNNGATTDSTVRNREEMCFLFLF